MERAISPFFILRGDSLTEHIVYEALDNGL